VSAKRSRTAQSPASADPERVEPVVTPASRGWLSSVEARAFLLDMFGETVSKRTIQGWCRDPKRPLRHVRMGHKLLVHREDLLARIGG
jgi:hypothetical protein